MDRAPRYGRRVALGISLVVALALIAGPLLTWAIPIGIAVALLAIGTAWTAMRIGSRWANRKGGSTWDE